MSTRSCDIAVIGGGPAGMMAAIEAARHGASVLIVDYRERLGGNFYKELRPLHRDAEASEHNSSAKELGQMRSELMQYNVGVLDRTTVWAVFHQSEAGGSSEASPAGAIQSGPQFLIHLSGPHVARLQARAVVVATGVYDRPLPFPGWTLPGIISPGGAQLLLKNRGVLPGRRILVAGTGPLLLAVAAALAEAGAEVVGLLEAAGAFDGWREGPAALWGQGARLKEAWGYLLSLRRHRVPLRFRSAVFRAVGDEAVQQVIFGRIDSDGRPAPGREEVVDVDTVCFGYGFLPLTSLTMHLGCDHRFDTDLRASIPVHDENMATTVGNVFVAGDVTGAGGKVLARLQGKIAGLAAARKIGVVKAKQARERQRDYSRAARKERRFAAALWRRYRVRPGLLDLIDENTPICRCEMVERRAIEQAVGEGYRDLNAVKRRTRAGMGPCQGRYCASVLSELVARQTGASPGENIPLTTRPPIMPIRAGELLGISGNDLMS